MPNTALTPGQALQKWAKDGEVETQDFAETMGYSHEKAEEILTGKRAVTFVIVRRLAERYGHKIAKPVIDAFEAQLDAEPA